MLNHTGRGYSSQNGGYASTANFSDVLNPTPIPTPSTIKAWESNINISRIIFLKFVLTTLWEGVDHSSAFPSTPLLQHGELRLANLPTLWED